MSDSVTLEVDLVSIMIVEQDLMKWPIRQQRTTLLGTEGVVVVGICC